MIYTSPEVVRGRPRQIVKIFWVGIAFDPDDPSSVEHESHDAVVRHFCRSGHREVQEIGYDGSLDTYPTPVGEAIHIFGLQGERIGFGIQVRDIQHGQERLERIAEYLQSIGVTVPVDTWVWEPMHVPSKKKRASYWGSWGWEVQQPQQHSA